MTPSKSTKLSLMAAFLVIGLVACGRSNSTSPAPAPTPTPTATPTKKTKKNNNNTNMPTRPPVNAPAPTSPNPQVSDIGEAPATVAGTKSLSSEYASNCAGCHGRDGNGRIGIRNKSLQEYRSAVRQGRGSMPAFSTSQYSDASLQNDHAVLSGN